VKHKGAIYAKEVSLSVLNNSKHEVTLRAAEDETIEHRETLELCAGEKVSLVGVYDTWYLN
jgi:hypothetical protein